MSNAFSRSWEITKASFNVIKHDKELLVFPVLSLVFSILFVLALVLPSSFFFAARNGGTYTFTGTEYFFFFLIYFVLAFFATFFNVCVVYTTKKRFEGGNATFGESIGFASSKLGLIFSWSLLAATVGVILRILENSARNSKGGGKVVMQIISSMFGMLWGVVTIFVVPVMVYEGVGPFAAIKKSVLILKKTWGESLIRYFGLGLVQSAFFFLGLLVFGLLGFMTLGTAFFFVILFIGLIYLFGVLLIFGVANTIYNVALYVYANTGKIPGEFSPEELKGAFKKIN